MVGREKCPKCNGNRWIKVLRAKGGGDFRKCPECNGTGFKIRITAN